MPTGRDGHIPIRSCVVCGKRKPRKELLRMALDPETKYIVTDSRNRLAGRGAYVCPECLPRLSMTGKVRRAFRNKAEGLSHERPPDN